MMKTSKLLALLLCIALSVFLLSACGKQAAEGPSPSQGTTQATQSQTESGNSLEEGELPAITIPQQTHPVTAPTEEAEVIKPPAATAPTVGTKPAEPTPTEPAPTQPEPTEPPETTPPEATRPTDPTETAPPEATEPPRLDPDELPPIPIS